MPRVRICRRGGPSCRRGLFVPGARARLGLGRRVLAACRRSVLVSAGSSRRAETALRIEQEHASRHDLFTFSEAVANFDAIGQLGADRHGPRLEHVADRHEHVLLEARVDDGVARYRDDVLSG
jgi:hypothetical protein